MTGSLPYRLITAAFFTLPFRVVMFFLKASNYCPGLILQKSGLVMPKWAAMETLGLIQTNCFITSMAIRSIILQAHPFLWVEPAPYFPIQISDLPVFPK